MKKSMRPPLGVGTLIVLMVLIVLLLCSFSVMSLISAKSDARLTEKAKDAVTIYYDADTKAEQKVAEIEKVLNNAQDWQNGLKYLDVNVNIKDDQSTLSFEVPMGIQVLSVELEQSLKNGKPSGDFVRIRWQVVGAF
jgi:flagellar basal body-associated protein FliL